MYKPRNWFVVIAVYSLAQNEEFGLTYNNIFLQITFQKGEGA